MIELDLKTAADWAGGKCAETFAGINFTSVSTDTRSLPKRCLFVCLRGPNFDGNNFIDEAFAKGAAAVMTECPEKLGDRPGIVVADSIRALGCVAEQYRWQRHLIPWFAVTGTNGKTTTRRLVAHILRTCRGKVCEPQANFNNFIGLPMTILHNDAETKFGILEMGTSGNGEIRRLAEIARPTIAAVTNIYHGHLQGLASVDGVANEKKEIFTFLNDHDLAIFPAQSPYAEMLRNHIRRGVHQKTFALDAPADVIARDVEVVPGGSKFSVGQQAFFLPLLGRHNIENFLIALIAVEHFGVSPEEAAVAAASFQPSEGRLQVTVKKNFTLIDDAYNANPESIQSAARVLLDYPARRRFLILADMCELGEHSRRLHQELGNWLAGTAVDVIVAIGKEMLALAEAVTARNAHQQVTYYPTTQSAISAIKNLIADGDVILVKGSHAMNLRRAVDYLKKLD